MKSNSKTRKTDAVFFYEFCIMNSALCIVHYELSLDHLAYLSIMALDDETLMVAGSIGAYEATYSVIDALRRCFIGFLSGDVLNAGGWIELSVISLNACGRR